MNMFLKKVISKKIGICKKIVSLFMIIAMLFTIVPGICVPKEVEAAENLLTEVGWTHVHEAWEPGKDDLIANTNVTDTTTGFKADISITGWQRLWSGYESIECGGGYGDSPYQLQSYTFVNLEPKTEYKLKFTLINNMRNSNGIPTEKNVTVSVGDNYQKTVRVPKNSTKTFELPINVEEVSGLVRINFAYGCYAYSFDLNEAGYDYSNPAYVYAPGTTEGTNATGLLEFKDMSLEKSSSYEGSGTEYSEGTGTDVDIPGLEDSTDISEVNKKGYKLVWNDEFQGSKLDSKKWNTDDATGAGGYGNNELQDYQPEYSEIRKGNLVIKPQFQWNKKTNEPVQDSYYSTKLWTRNQHAFKYGKIEIRAKMPKGEGTSAMGWMLRQNGNSWPNDGEIDIFQTTNDSTKSTIEQGLINAAFNPMVWSDGQKVWNSTITDATSAYHIYGINWSKEFIEFTVDDKIIGIYNSSDYLSQDGSNYASVWPFDKEFFLTLNCSIGGVIGGGVSPIGWTKIATEGDIETYQDYLCIDWVRVYEEDKGQTTEQPTEKEPVTAPDFSGKYDEVEVNKKISAPWNQEGYYFTLQKPGKVTVSANSDYQEALRTLNIAVYEINADGDESRITWNKENDGKNTQTEPVRLNAGTYVVKAFGLNDSSEGIADMIINYQEESSEFYEIEKNNSFQSANKIELNREYTGNIQLNEDKDYYKIELPQAGSLYINLRNAISSSKWRVVLYAEDSNSNRNMIDAWINDEDRNTMFTKYRLPKGTYYIYVESSAYIDASDYQIGTTYVPETNENCEIEYNDTVDKVNLIKADREYRGNIATEKDKDYFQFTIDKISNVMVSLRQESEYITDKLYEITLYKKENTDTLIEYDNFYSVANTVSFGNEVKLPKGDYVVMIRNGNGDAEDKNDYFVKIQVKAETNPSDTKQTTVFQDQGTTKSNHNQPSQLVSAKTSAPKKVSLSKPKNLKGRKIKLSWKRIKNVSGYQIMYATNKKFTKSKKIVTLKANVVNKTIKKLKKKKVYYFKVRAYITIKSKKLYGQWSKVKSVKIKK